MAKTSLTSMSVEALLKLRDDIGDVSAARLVSYKVSSLLWATADG